MDGPIIQCPYTWNKTTYGARSTPAVTKVLQKLVDVQEVTSSRDERET